MAPDFSRPQRQSPVGVIVMFADSVVAFGKALFPILVIWLLKFDTTKTLLFSLAGGAAFALLVLVAWLRYRNFTFFLDAKQGEFVLTEGILNKTRTVVKLGKIQKVDITQSLLQRLIGVHEVKVDTAGTNKEEISIKAVSHSLAVHLKDALLESAADLRPEIGTTQELTAEKPFVRIRLASLIKMGLTAHYVRTFLVILAFFLSTYENLRHVDVAGNVDTGAIERYVEENPAVQVAVSFFLFVFAVILVVNVIRTIFRYFDYRIVQQGDSLLLSFGLVTTKNTLIRPGRVQFVSVTRNFLQKKLDILELRIRQATAGEEQNRKTAIEVPGCNPDEHDAILRLLFGNVPEKGLMLRPNWRQLGFSLFLSLILPVGLFLALRIRIPELESVDYLVAVYAVVVLLLQTIRFRNSRLFVGERFIVRKHGAWDVTHDYLEAKKIQGITVSQLFWHKSLNIGSLTLHTAGGDLSFHLGNFETIQSYVNLWLYRIEKSDSDWM